MGTAPFLELYQRLRENGLLLGIEEYKLFVKALQMGYGFPDRAALERLCKTLWVKSIEDEQIFDRYFNLLIPLSPGETETSEMHDSNFDQPLPQPDTTPDTPPDRPQNNETNLPVQPSTDTGKTTGIGRGNGEVSIPVAVQLKTSSFIFSEHYFPVNHRQLKQKWQHLRHPIRQGPSEELNIEATLGLAAERGMLVELILRARRVNRTELLILIDHGGSMVPFHLFSQNLIDTVQRRGYLGEVYLYFFHNCPDEYLYKDTVHLEYESIDAVLNRYYPPSTGVLIFSDAGAARGGFNQERIELTEIFIERLKQGFRYIAWLNPLPRKRWRGTSAEAIRQWVPMFGLNMEGVDNILNVLRGRSVHFKERDYE